MTDQQGGSQVLEAGTPVIALDGEQLGIVREAHPHYVLVDQDGHDDLNVPVHAIQELVNGVLRLAVNRSALTEIDHEETVHHERVDEVPDQL